MAHAKEHKNSEKQPNRLIHEKSPYLLQHAYNPVDWYPWGDEAFEKARKEDKPIFLSIGYSTCHWCHVMERESFEDNEVARLLNESFVSVKVDREERPDLDHFYMTVCQGLTGSGGWPLTVVLTPGKEPFFAGTYFPRESRHGRIGMTELLIILVLVLIIFGAGKLPEIGQGMGKAIGNFRKSVRETNEVDITPKDEKKIEEKEESEQA